MATRAAMRPASRASTGNPTSSSWRRARRDALEGGVAAVAPLPAGPGHGQLSLGLPAGSLLTAERPPSLLSGGQRHVGLAVEEGGVGDEEERFGGLGGVARRRQIVGRLLGQLPRLRDEADSQEDLAAVELQSTPGKAEGDEALLDAVVDGEGAGEVAGPCGHEPQVVPGLRRHPGLIQGLADGGDPAEVVGRRRRHAGVGQHDAPVEQDGGLADRLPVPAEDAEGPPVAGVGLGRPAESLQEQRPLMEHAAERSAPGRVGGQIGLLEGLAGLAQVEEHQCQGRPRSHGPGDEAVGGSQVDGGVEMCRGLGDLAGLARGQPEGLVGITCGRHIPAGPGRSQGPGCQDPCPLGLSINQGKGLGRPIRGPVGGGGAVDRGDGLNDAVSYIDSITSIRSVGRCGP